jgi:hyperosmotically inducible periplasmic protein
MALKPRFCALLGAIMLAASPVGYAQSPDRDRPAGQQSIGERIDDVVLNTKVRTALVRERSLASGDIWVKADNGTVTLGGSVASADEKRTAETVAKAVDGVQLVKNELDIKAR